MSRKKICFVVTIPEIVHAFLRDHIKALSQEYDVYLVGDIPNSDKIEGLALKGYKNIKINRKISVIKDLKAVYSLVKYIKYMRFDAVHSAMPKAGLVAALASKISGVPNRIHIFTGQVWATKTGLMKTLLMTVDTAICKLNNYILVDGISQKDYLVKEGVVSAQKAIVFGSGSICGVNIERFKPDMQIRQVERSKYGLDNNDLAFIFLGRLNHDKGTIDLLKAFNSIAGKHKGVCLLLAGADEDNCMSTLDQYPNIEKGKNLFYVGYVKTPEFYLQAGDVFCLPSYREGFGSSVIEAACLGIPSICSDAYGLMDAMIDGETGLRCSVGDINSLFLCMEKYYEDRALLKENGEKARSRVLHYFSGELITNYWIQFYNNLLK